MKIICLILLVLCFARAQDTDDVKNKVQDVEFDTSFNEDQKAKAAQRNCKRTKLAAEQKANLTIWEASCQQTVAKEWVCVRDGGAHDCKFKPAGAEKALTVLWCFWGFNFLIVIILGRFGGLCSPCLTCLDREKKSLTRTEKFLDSEPDLADSYCSSLWIYLKSVDPFLGQFINDVSHFCSRYDNGVTNLFNMSWGMLIQSMVEVQVDEGQELYLMLFFLITIPNALIWPVLLQSFRRCAVRRELKNKGEDACCCYYLCDKFKNIIFIVISFVLALGATFFVKEHANPNTFLAKYFFYSVLFAFIFGNITGIIFFSLSYYIKVRNVQSGCIYRITWCCCALPPSVSSDKVPYSSSV